MDYVNALTRLVAVPERPQHAQGNFTWSDVETAIGFALPEDYKALINLYGYGYFADYLVLYSPFKGNTVQDFIKTVTMFSEGMKQRKDKFPEDALPFVFYPYEKFLPLGFTDDTGMVIWNYSSEVSFLVTIDADFSNNFGHYRKSVSQFIYEWTKGDFVPYGFENAQEISDKAFFRPLAA